MRTRTMSYRGLTFAPLLAAVIFAAACGGDDKPVVKYPTGGADDAGVATGTNISTDTGAQVGTTDGPSAHAELEGAAKDAYDRGFIPNHSDASGRYAFDQQPQVGLWNCARLGEALHSLVSEDDAVAALASYRATFELEMDRLMRAKLGLATAEPTDGALVAELLGVLHDGRVDYTRFFRSLSRYATNNAIALHAQVADADRLNGWLARYDQRLLREGSIDASRHERMLRANPKFVLRNWLAQEAIANAETGNYERIEELRVLLKTPFDEHPDDDRYAAKPPEWAREIAVSCSS